MRPVPEARHDSPSGGVIGQVGVSAGGMKAVDDEKAGATLLDVVEDIGDRVGVVSALAIGAEVAIPVVQEGNHASVGEIEGIFLGYSIQEWHSFLSRFLVSRPVNGRFLQFVAERLATGGELPCDVGGKEGFSGFGGSGEDNESGVGDEVGDEPAFGSFVGVGVLGVGEGADVLRDSHAL